MEGKGVGEVFYLVWDDSRVTNMESIPYWRLEKSIFWNLAPYRTPDTIPIQFSCKSITKCWQVYRTHFSGISIIDFGQLNRVPYDETGSFFNVIIFLLWKQYIWCTDVCKTKQQKHRICKYFLWNSCQNKLCYMHFTRGGCFERPISPASIYLLKVNNRNTTARCKICSRLTIKTVERHH